LVKRAGGGGRTGRGENAGWAAQVRGLTQDRSVDREERRF